MGVSKGRGYLRFHSHYSGLITMKVFAFSTLMFYLSWLPFWVVRNEVIGISINNVALMETELKYLAWFYLPVSLLVSSIPILIFWIRNLKARNRRNQVKLEGALRENASLQIQLDKKETVKFGSLRGYFR